jgi:hypothetical protein
VIDSNDYDLFNGIGSAITYEVGEEMWAWADTIYNIGDPLYPRILASAMGQTGLITRTRLTEIMTRLDQPGGLGNSVNANLSTTWIISTDYAYQSVAVAGITTEAKGLVGLNPSCTAAQYIAAIAASLHCSSVNNGYIIVKAFGTVPTITIPITVEW